MSIKRCPYCDEEYDQDYDVEHEEICKEEMNSEAIKNLNKLQTFKRFEYK